MNPLLSWFILAIFFIAVSGKDNGSHKDFGKNLMQVLLEKDGDDKNTIVSPLTVHMLMSMLYLGSPDNSNTFKQLAKALSLESSGQEALKFYQDMIKHYDEISHDKSANSTLRLAGTMVLKDDFKIKDDFNSLMKKYFSATSQKFKTPDKGMSIVNEWAEEKTDGVIKEILKEGDIEGDTMMVLASACYFKSDWRIRFNKGDTRPMDFTLPNKKKVKIERGMSKTASFRYAKTNDFEVIELPYTNEEFSMYIALPKEKSMRGLNKLAAGFDLSSFKDNLKPTGIQLIMPAFDASSEIDLKEPLMAMGIKDAFDNNADFSKITDGQIRVDKTKTKTVVKVDEEGTEAAAVAVATFATKSAKIGPPPMNFIVDRPFMFMIYDKKFHAPLFVGRMVNPQ